MKLWEIWKFISIAALCRDNVLDACYSIFKVLCFHVTSLIDKLLEESCHELGALSNLGQNVRLFDLWCLTWFYEGRGLLFRIFGSSPFDCNILSFDKCTLPFLMQLGPIVWVRSPMTHFEVLYSAERCHGVFAETLFKGLQEHDFVVVN